MMIKQFSELFFILAGFIFTVAIFPNQFHAVYTTVQIAISGTVISLIGLFISFPVSPDFNRALASSIGSLGFCFAFFFLISLIGFSLTGGISFFSIGTLFYILLFVASFSAALFFKVKGRVW